MLSWQRFLLAIYKVHLDRRVPYFLPGLKRKRVSSGQENFHPSTGTGKNSPTRAAGGNSIKPPGR